MKGRMMLRGLFQAGKVNALLVAAAWTAQSAGMPALVPPLAAAGHFLSVMTLAALATWLGWNAWDELSWYVAEGAGERKLRSFERERARVVRSVERQRERMREDDWRAQILLARTAGTLSFNGQRFPGAPQPGSVSYTTVPGSFSYATGSYPYCNGSVRISRVNKSECDHCGAPMDAVWCPPGLPYLCKQCLQAEILRNTSLSP